jgi:hypothetical protein
MIIMLFFNEDQKIPIDDGKMSTQKMIQQFNE